MCMTIRNEEKLTVDKKIWRRIGRIKNNERRRIQNVRQIIEILSCFEKVNSI